MDRVTVREKTTTETATGHTETLANVATLRCQVVELSTTARQAYGSIKGEVTHEVRVRGSATFEFGKTEFLWGTRRLRPLRPAGHPGHTRRGYTFIPCAEEFD